MTATGHGGGARAGAPLLSICVPTYERADSLRLALDSIAPEVAALDGAVELVISDNCSADATPHVIATAASRWPLRSYRNDTNVGPQRNILLVVERAHGEYCWLLGDDDMMLRGQLHRLVLALREHPGPDALFVNYYVASHAHRDRLVRDHDCGWVPEEEPVPLLHGRETWFAERDDRVLDRWEDLLAFDAGIPAATFTSIVGHVFRRSAWRAQLHNVRLEGPPQLESAYPHLKVLAHALVGRPAFYVGEPVAVQGLGAPADWSDYSAAIVAIRFSQALVLYEELGADPELIRTCRRAFVARGGVLEWSLNKLLRDRRVLGRRYFSLRRLFAENREFAPQLLAMVLRVYGHALRNQGRHLPPPVRRTLRAAYRTAARAR
jgi:glycosyltransferase involved in cell wall biosynthesis